MASNTSGKVIFVLCLLFYPSICLIIFISWMEVWVLGWRSVYGICFSTSLLLSSKSHLTNFQVRQELSPFWTVLADELPMKLISRKAPTVPVASFIFLFFYLVVYSFFVLYTNCKFSSSFIPSWRYMNVAVLFTIWKFSCNAIFNPLD